MGAGRNRAEIDRIAGEIVDASIAIHRALGPGLLESAYEACLLYELRERGLVVEKQVPLPVTYKGVRLEAGYRLDIVVENEVIVEIKSVDDLAPIHTAQLLSYLKLSHRKVGFLINFNVELVKNGIKRIANNL